MTAIHTIQAKKKPFFNDQQLKRVIVQVMSVFAGFSVQGGVDSTGSRKITQVPIIYGDYDTSVAYILQGGNDNAMQTLPAMSLNLTSMRQSKEMRRAPQHSEKIWYTPRQANSDGALSGEPATELLVERYMPVPYDLSFTLSLWTSNKDQGFQLIEQICSYFNPELDLQLSNSPADWIFMTVLRFMGDVRFNSTPTDPGGSGNDDKTYIYSMDFNTTAHLSLPVKVYEAKLIETIHTNLKELNETIDFDTMSDIEGFVIS